MPRITNKARVEGLAQARGWSAIGEAEWRELRLALPEVSERALRAAGIPIAVPWCGVAQHSLDELEGSLRAFSAVYAARPDLRRYCRDQVITAKDHARWVSKSARVAEEVREVKREMVAWMLVWLDDPAMFPVWVGIRRGG